MLQVETSLYLLQFEMKMREKYLNFRQEIHYQKMYKYILWYMVM